MRVFNFTIVTLFFLQAHAQFLNEAVQFVNRPSDIRRSKVFGVDIYRYSIKNNKPADSILLQQNVYDTLGNVLFIKSLNSQTTFAYEGSKIITATEDYTKDGYIIVHSFKYDSVGRLSEEHSYSPEKLHLISYKYEYFLDGKVKSVYQKTDTSAYTLRKTLTYKGGKVDTVREFMNNKPQSATVYEYDDNLRTVTVYYLYKNKKTKYLQQQYDEKGGLVHEVIYASATEDGLKKGNPTNWFFVVDDNNLRLESKTEYDGHITLFYRYFYRKKS